MVLPRDFVVFDTETTGSPPGARLVEIGALKVRGFNVLDRFETLVYPEGPIPESARAVHGLSDEDVVDAPAADEVLPRFFEWAAGLPLMAHNARFDAAVLASECARFNLPAGGNEVLCTLNASRTLLARRSHSLESLVRELGLPSAPHHRAVADAEHALNLYWRLLEVAGGRFHRRALGRGRTVESYLPAAPRLPSSRRVLEEAAGMQEAVDMQYSLKSHRVVPLRVTPRFFYTRRDAVLMEGLCHQDLHYKSYRLDRIVAAHPCPDAAPVAVRRNRRFQR